MRRNTSLRSIAPRTTLTALSTLTALAAFCALVTLAAPVAGAQQQHEMKEHGMSNWKEMDAFHAALGSAFHPSEQGNLAPLKATADTLAARAKAWSASTPPASCASDDSKASVTWLATRTADLATAVRSGATDATLKERIAAIHERFETVEKACGGMHEMKGMKH